jgi:DNA replication licensing factor MCM6
MSALDRSILSSRADAPVETSRRTQMPVEIERVIDETADQVRRDFETFLTSYQDAETNSQLYIEQIKLLPKTNSATIYIDYVHLETFSDILAEAITLHYFRYLFE